MGLTDALLPPSRTQSRPQYAIILVIDNSVPRVLRMLVQIVPIFVGFTLLGVMIFGAYFPRFGSFSW